MEKTIYYYIIVMVVVESKFFLQMFIMYCKFVT